MATFIKKHWRSELVALFSAVLTFGLLSIENRAELGVEAFPLMPSNPPALSLPLRGYGGDLPAPVGSAIREMAGNLAQARGIETAQARCIEFVDATGAKRTYGFRHEAVWWDGSPAIGNVLSFHFEYRDQWGNLLARGDSDPGAIRSIGLAIRIADRGREIAASLKVNLNSGNRTPSGGFAFVR